MAQLRVTSSVLNGQAFNLEGEYYTIGREADNTILLPHQSISKHHAMITVDNGDFKLWDLHSTNGIVINGQKTVLRHLKDGDKIVLGDVEFLFTSNGLPTPAKPAPQAETQRIVLPPPISKAATAPAPKPLVPVEPPLPKVPELKIAKPVVSPASVPPVSPTIPAPPLEPKPAAVPAPAVNAVTPVVIPPPPLPSEPKSIVLKKPAPLAVTQSPPVPSVESKPVTVLAPRAVTSAVIPSPPPLPSEPKSIVLKEPAPLAPVNQPPPVPSVESKPLTVPAPRAVSPAIPLPLPPQPNVAPVLSQAPTPKIEIPVVAPVPAAPPPPQSPLPAAELKSMPPVDLPLPDASPSKAETKEIRIPAMSPEAPKIKVSLDLHPRTPLTPAPATPEPLKSISDLPKEMNLQPPQPEPQPVAAAHESAPARRSVSGGPARRRLIYLIMFLAGVGLLMAGYGFNITGCKFIGFILAITGFICLYFAFRFKGIVAPPR